MDTENIVKHIKKTQRYPIIIYAASLILGIVSCDQQSNRNGKAIPSLFPAPVIVPLNTTEGYTYNVFTGKPISAAINHNGDSIITGRPIPVAGQLVEGSDVGKERVVRAGEPSVVSIDRKKQLIQAEPKPVFLKMDEDREFVPERDLENFSLINSTGDTIQTGVPLKITGSPSPCMHTLPATVLQPAVKDHARIDIKFFDQKRGMNSNYVFCGLEDRQGNLWFGTLNGGVSMFNGSAFKQYTVKEGLGDNRVNSIIEDNEGKLWFATSEGGVIMFDGDSFVHFTEKEGLSSNDFLTLFQDSRGNIWFGSNDGGAIKYDGETVTHYALSEGISTIIMGIEEDRKGNLWFSTYRSGVFRFDGRNFTHYNKEDGLGDNCVNPILEDSKGNIWFGTWGGGVTKFDGESFTQYTKSDGLCDDNVSDIFEDSEGILWLGTWEGLSRFDGESFTNITEADGLSYNDVVSITEDSFGNLWLGTWGGGVNCFNPHSFVHLSERDGLVDDHVFSIMEDRDGLIWFGSWRGVSSFDGNVIKTYASEQGLGFNYVNAILQDREGRYWFGTDGGGISRFDGAFFTTYSLEQGLIDNRVNCLTEDRYGNIWAGTKEGGAVKLDGDKILRFTDNEGMVDNYVNCILEDSQGVIWFGTKRGLTKFDGASFIHFTESEGLSMNEVNTLFEDHDGQIWIGTNGGGVNVFDGSNFSYITKREGLVNNNINSIIEDNKGEIWISTNMGISKIKTGLPIRNFGVLDGLSILEFYKNSVLLDSKNRLWWGGNQNLTMLDLEHFRLSDRTPVVDMDYVEIGENYMDFRHREDLKDLGIRFDSVESFKNYPLNLVVAYKSNMLRFHFNAIDWAAPHNIRYSYKMDGLYNQWSQPQTEGYLEYHSLPDGVYTLRVSACGDAGVWSEPFIYKFTVLAPWWKTIAFRVIMGLAVVIFLVLLFNWRTSAIRKRKIELEEQVVRRTEELLQVNEELKQTQSHLVQSEKMASLGVLTAGIAHEINNPINFIYAGIKTLERNWRDIELFMQKCFEIILEDPEKEDAKAIEVIKKEFNLEDSFESNPELISNITYGTKRITEIVQGLRDFSRSDQGKLQEASMQEIIESALLLLSNITKNGIDIERKFGNNIPKIECYPGELNQVFLNLFTNAVDAIEEKYGSESKNKGKISIEIRTGQEMSKKWIRVIVSDNGSGIPAKFLEKIYDPFFTTKEVGKGVGLGLSIVHGIIKKHDGMIRVKSEVGVGTRFEIFIP